MISINYGNTGFTVSKKQPCDLTKDIITIKEEKQVKKDYLPIDKPYIKLNSYFCT
jgi:hypothetical protein